MIDIHNHILPGIDDGPTNWDEALELARNAVENGITTVIATPHHAHELYNNPNDHRQVESLTEQLNERLKLAGIPLQVHSGQEIRVHQDLLDRWDEGETGGLLTLGYTQYMLIELPSSRVPEGTEELVYELILKGIIPIIAHPERNRELANDPEQLRRLVDNGALAQVTAHALTGVFGRGVEKAAWMMCAQGLIHFVASDAHHATKRSFGLREAYERIQEKMGVQAVHYYKRNAQLLLDNASIQPAAVTTAATEGAWSKVKQLFGLRK
ncbi:protein-tyrosine phosphatase [Paenibacillus cellulosilyticus]|uniref:Tyrosine-protein phosphatase n=1 Tax=Paenibacillus cellulosilyticus TaxID=375489 RepID=A0A2V2Z0N8_9BACL|nr:CpsB/CapC family capsule biosynthesis tyrosine phosphatase [Paenibacillus cellulosilyticus]PWW08417.1 protein-tyrosine phosphatase [Paenibacillus cellulosilyticus]QKS48005.1 protein tyrosine phosphatase [Paenibacillus cellulosilyticus]